MMISGTRMQVEVSPQRMDEMLKSFRSKKPITWNGKKYLILSGGVINYHHDTKTWHTDLTLKSIVKETKKNEQP